MSSESKFMQWRDRKIDFGGFADKLFKAYMHADSTNAELLEKAFPHFFKPLIDLRRD